MAVMKEKHYRADHYSDDPDLLPDETPQGKIAITNYRALAVYGRLDATGGQPAAALVECRLETGRTHQIRVHMASIGCPLVGDKLYGGDEQLFLRELEGGLDDDARAELGLDRHALHSHTLRFHHPRLGREIELEAPLPADMQALLDGAM